MPENAVSILLPAILLLAAVVGGVAIFRRMKPSSVDDRLSQFADRRGGSAAGEKSTSAIAQRLDAVLSKNKNSSDMARDLAQADLKLTVTEFLLFKLGSVCVFALVGLFIGRAGPYAMLAGLLIGGLIGLYVPGMYVGMKQRKRLKAFNDQLGDTVMLLANSLRSGYSLLQSMEMVSRESQPPVSQEFRRVVQEVGLGLSLEESLNNMMRRVPSEDLDLMITAIIIQFEVGGNLSEILETIGSTIRERVRIKGQIRVLTSQARYSGYVVSLLPIAIAAIISGINPEFMAPIFTFGFPPEAWCCLPCGSLVMMLAGFLVIRKIVDIEV
ncbi:MAG TPA: type II secretion system F family protein [Herpetosiphonaceae bacterium]